MTWTLFIQICVFVILGAITLVAAITAIRRRHDPVPVPGPRGPHGPAGPMGPPGPMGKPGAACTGVCCRPTTLR